MFTNDYIMRQIENLANFLGKVIFQKETFKLEIFDNEWNFSGEGLLYLRLKKMVDEGEINEAENLLYYEIDRQQPEKLMAVALRFYNDLQQLSDERLSECGFSRIEILEGLTELKQALGIDDEEAATPLPEDQ